MRAARIGIAAAALTAGVLVLGATRGGPADVLTIGTVNVSSGTGQVKVPFSIQDNTGTLIGRDKGAGLRITIFAAQVVYGPNACIDTPASASARIDLTGGILASQSADLDSRVKVANTSQTWFYSSARVERAHPVHGGREPRRPDGTVGLRSDRLPRRPDQPDRHRRGRLRKPCSAPTAPRPRPPATGASWSSTERSTSCPRPIRRRARRPTRPRTRRPTRRHSRPPIHPPLPRRSPRPSRRQSRRQGRCRRPPRTRRQTRRPAPRRARRRTRRLPP